MTRYLYHVIRLGLLSTEQVRIDDLYPLKDDYYSPDSAEEAARVGARLWAFRQGCRESAKVRVYVVDLEDPMNPNRSSPSLCRWFDFDVIPETVSELLARVKDKEPS